MQWTIRLSLSVGLFAIFAFAMWPNATVAPPKRILFCPVPSFKWQQFVSSLLFMGSFFLDAITFNGNRARCNRRKCQHKSNAHWDSSGNWRLARGKALCGGSNNIDIVYSVVYALSFWFFLRSPSNSASHHRRGLRRNIIIYFYELRLTRRTKSLWSIVCLIWWWRDVLKQLIGH